MVRGRPWPIRGIVLALGLAQVPLLVGRPPWIPLVLGTLLALVVGSPRYATVLVAYAIPCLVAAPWPVHCYAAAAAWMITSNEWRTLREGWRETLKPGVLATLVVVGSAAGLAVIILEHERIVAGLVMPVSPPSLPALVVAIPVVAVVNALGEELVWRGILADRSRGLSRGWRMTLQVVSFGVAHIHGIPAGAAGVIASGGFSALVYRIRHRHGFSSALVVHVVTDLAVFWFVARHALFAWSG